METVSTNQITTSSYTIPLDVLLDIVRILLEYAIQWQVEGINEKENSLLIQVRIQPSLSHQRKALDNMKAVLSDYGHYLRGSPGNDVEQY
jgi:hypothetical protein